jgi:uncharacterized phage-associated protein
LSNALSIAKELVRLSFAGDEPDPLTNLRLQKLLYYAQAWSFIVRESNLFDDEIQAWQLGPVVPKVYQALPEGQGANTISNTAFANEPDLTPDEAEFVRSVWEAYRPYSATQLSKMTHEELPWQKAWGKRPASAKGYDPIAIDDMEDFFAHQSMPAALVAYGHKQRQREEEARLALAAMPQISVEHLMSRANSFSASVNRPGK